MEDVKTVLWKVLNNEAPLVDDDIRMYHIKEGILTEDDLKKWREAIRLIREAYHDAYKTRTLLLRKLGNL
jgi:hypothetical protein